MAVRESVERVLLSVRGELAPDPRTALFDVGIFEDGPALTVAGITSEPGAAEALARRLGTLATDVPLRVEIRLLPLPDAERAHAVCTAAVAPMCAGPLPSDAPLSQALLGHRLHVLREDGPWLHCRSGDGYLGWIHRGYLRLLTESEARKWESGEGGRRYTSLGARAVADDGSPLVPLPWGSRVVGDGRGGVRLPDGREGRVEGELVSEEERGTRFPLRSEAIVRTALEWIGAPYVWGGLTMAGVDCSGLVQLVFRMHGLELPRDSDQQAGRGEALGADDPSVFLPGDLIFFAERSARISHVAISMGGSRIVHAALGSGGVTVDDLAGGSDRERELRRLVVGARRVVAS